MDFGAKNRSARTVQAPILFAAFASFAVLVAAFVLLVRLLRQTQRGWSWLTFGSPLESLNKAPSAPQSASQSLVRPESKESERPLFRTSLSFRQKRSKETIIAVSSRCHLHHRPHFRFLSPSRVFRGRVHDVRGGTEGIFSNVKRCFPEHAHNVRGGADSFILPDDARSVQRPRRKGRTIPFPLESPNKATSAPRSSSQNAQNAMQSKPRKRLISGIRRHFHAVYDKPREAVLLDILQVFP